MPVRDESTKLDPPPPEVASGGLKSWSSTECVFLSGSTRKYSD